MLNPSPPPAIVKPPQSEYLSGFIGGGDEAGEYAGYGALDSGGEEADNEGGGAEGGGPGGDSAARESAEVCNSSGAAAAATSDGGGRGKNLGFCVAGPEEGGGQDEGGVDPAHIEVSAESQHRNAMLLVPHRLWMSTCGIYFALKTRRRS